MIHYVYADSRNRAPGTSGNSYVLTLTSSVRNVYRVDLVAAKVPNTLYNITHGTNCFSVNSQNFSLSPGFYSAPFLAQAISNACGLAVTYQPPFGTFQFMGSNVFTITANTPETQNTFGLFSQTGITVNSSNVVNLGSEEFVFLDIMELRNRTVIDSKTLIGDTYAGSTIATSFAMIPLDVISGNFKTFKETTDYKMSVSFDSAIPRLTRLTVQWLNKDGLPVNFNGMDTNSFLLRVHCRDSAPEPEEPPPLDEELLLKKIQRAVEDASPKPAPKSPWRFVAIPLVLAILLLLSRTLSRGN